MYSTVSNNIGCKDSVGEKDLKKHRLQRCPRRTPTATCKFEAPDVYVRIGRKGDPK